MSRLLTKHQKRLAQHRMTFATDLLSPEIAESLRRASLACAENQKGETGIIEFICGLYLQDQKEITSHFRGDFSELVSRTFPQHRFGQEGLVPRVMLDGMASGVDSCGSGFSYTLEYGDELHRLLWLSARLANAVGKKASLKDVVAACSLNKYWVDELARNGLELTRILADFEREVATVMFHTSVHSSEGWPREMDFEHDGSFQAPFTLELSTPSGPFQPVRSAQVTLNESEVASIEWPQKPTVSVIVELRPVNKIKFELDGPVHFASVEVTVRGIPCKQ